LRGGGTGEGGVRGYIAGWVSSLRPSPEAQGTLQVPGAGLAPGEGPPGGLVAPGLAYSTDRGTEDTDDEGHRVSYFIFFAIKNTELFCCYNETSILGRPQRLNRLS